MRPGSQKQFVRPFTLGFTATTGRTYLPYLRKHLTLARPHLSAGLVELSVALVGDKTMSDLHFRFLAIAGPTDVLTFPLDGSSGEVVICVPEAQRRCRGTGHPVREELLLYALHGMLHLCGYDDRTDRDYRRMHRKEDQILTRIGVGAVFDRRPVGAV